eukprot:Ihof_evm6s168 gene=Ihof_evmTU6s168
MSDFIKAALSEDIRGLLTTFQKQPEGYEFSLYAKYWREANFSMLHYCCSQMDRRISILKKAYDVTLGLLATSPHVDVFVFVIYTLYSLFSTQSCEPKLLIEVDKYTWSLLVDLHKAAVKKNLFEVDYVFHRMVYLYP